MKKKDTYHFVIVLLVFAVCMQALFLVAQVSPTSMPMNFATVDLSVCVDSCALEEKNHEEEKEEFVNTFYPFSTADLFVTFYGSYQALEVESIEVDLLREYDIAHPFPGQSFGRDVHWVLLVSSPNNGDISFNVPLTWDGQGETFALKAYDGTWGDVLLESKSQDAEYLYYTVSDKEYQALVLYSVEDAAQNTVDKRPSFFATFFSSFSSFFLGNDVA